MSAALGSVLGGLCFLSYVLGIDPDRLYVFIAPAAWAAVKVGGTTFWMGLFVPLLALQWTLICFVVQMVIRLTILAGKTFVAK